MRRLSGRDVPVENAELDVELRPEDVVDDVCVEVDSNAGST